MGDFEALFGPSLKNSEGAVETKATLEPQANIGIYFASAAHTEFSETLVKAWSENLRDKGLTVVVVVPMDGTEEEAAWMWGEAFAAMPWLALPFDAQEQKDALVEKFGDKEAPGDARLILLDAQAEVLTLDGVKEVSEDPAGENFPWKEEVIPVLGEEELLVRLGPMPPDPGESGLKGVFLNQKHFVTLGLVTQEEEADDVPFSGFKFKPYIFVNRAEKLAEVKKMGFASDWDPYKKDLEGFKGEEILIMFDPERGYGDSLVMTTKKDAYEREWGRIQEKIDEVKAAFDEEHAPKPKGGGGGGGGGGGADGGGGAEDDMADDNVIVRDEPKECKEWVSDTMEATHAEVSNFIVANSRPQMQVMITRPRQMFGKSCKFSDSGDNLQGCRPQKDPNFALPFRRELDVGIQAVREVKTVACQTTWFRPVNKSTQYSAGDFLPKDEAAVADEKVSSLTDFLTTVSTSVEEALQTNETVDIFQEEFAHLGEEEAGDISKASSGLQEIRTFTDVGFTKGKRVEWIEWVPNSTDMIVASYCENMVFYDKLDNAGKAGVSSILIWSFKDSLAPHANLIAPWEVTHFRFYPSDHKYIVGGLMSGQLCVWKVSDMDLGYVLREKAKPTGHDEKTSTVPSIMHKVISIIDDSHRRPVTALEWLPPTIELERRGRGASEKHSKDSPVKYFITLGGDGQVMIWDFLTMLETIGDADLMWRPVLKVQLNRQDSGTEMGCCQALYCRERYDGKGAKLLTNFFASTEEGELIFGDWAATGGEDRKPEFCKQMFTNSKTFRPALSLECSPFFPNILLTVTDWAFYLWEDEMLRDGIKEPLFQSSSPSTAFTRGVWSPTRPSVIFLGLASGCIDIWDFSDQSHKASVMATVTSQAISSMMFLNPKTDSRETDQKLAIGDSHGNLHVHVIPKNLVKQAGKEHVRMKEFLDREANRVRYFQDRKQQLSALKEERVKQAQMAEEVEEGDQKKGPDEDIADAAAEKLYQTLKADCLEELREMKT